MSTVSLMSDTGYQLTKKEITREAIRVLNVRSLSFREKFRPFKKRIFSFMFNEFIVGADRECSRGRSRVVRGVIDHSLRPVYKALATEVPRACPFQSNRDIYNLHEAHKTEESYGKWYCEFCGKSFYSESFLDDHHQNRHADKLYMGADYVCLSDYCDIFRCDVISRRVDPDFWDVALCIDDDMADLVNKCHKVFSSCVPPDISSENKRNLLNKTKSVVCGSLTCNRYWYTGKIDDWQWKMLLKTFLTVFLIGGMIVYYFLAYHHFYTESLYDRPPTPPLPYKQYNPQHTQVRRKVRKKHAIPLT